MDAGQSLAPQNIFVDLLSKIPCFKLPSRNKLLASPRTKTNMKFVKEISKLANQIEANIKKVYPVIPNIQTSLNMLGVDKDSCIDIE